MKNNNQINRGLSPIFTIFTPHPLYTGLGQNMESRTKAYQRLFNAHIDKEMITNIRDATNGNFALGNDKFKDQIETMLNRRARPGKSGRPKHEK